MGNVYNIVDELTEEQRRAERRAMEKIAGGKFAPLYEDKPPDPMTIDGIDSREFYNRENLAMQQGKTFQQTDEGEGFYPEGEAQPELIGPAALAAALAANAEESGPPAAAANAAAPANAAVGFTPPPDITPPPTALTPFRDAFPRAAHADTLVSTTTQDEIDQLAAAGQPALPDIRSPAFDDEVVASGDPLDALQMAQALAQPQIDMPPPDIPDMSIPDQRMDDFIRLQAQTPGIDVLEGGAVEPTGPIDRLAGLTMGSSRGLRRLFPRTTEANELIEQERLAQEEYGAEGAESGGEAIQLATRRGALRTTSAIRDVGSSLLETATDIARPVGRFFRGLAGPAGPELDGPPDIYAANVEEEAGEPTGSKRVEEHADKNAADLNSATENEVFGPNDEELGVNPPVSGTEARNVEKAVEGGPGDDGVVDIHGGSNGIQSGGGGSAIDRALGPKLLPRDQRGPGVEVIRGMRRKFQPTLDMPDIADTGGDIFAEPEGGFPTGGQATGSEIPFGEGAIERLFNAGYSRDESAKLALDFENADQELIRAGALRLAAQSRAVTMLPHGVPQKDGTTLEAMVILDGNGGIRVQELDVVRPITATMYEYGVPTEFADSFGGSTFEDVPHFLIPDGLGGMREAIPDTSEADMSRLLATRINQELFAGFINTPEVQELEEIDQVNEAFELLKEHLAKTSGK